MKPYITKFGTSNAEPGTALTSGEVDIAAWTDGRTFGVQAAGNKHIQFALPAPGSPMLTICFMKVKNGSDGGWEYLNCASDAKNQALWNQFFPGYYMTHQNNDYQRSEEHTSELQSPCNLVCRLLLEKKKYSLSTYIPTTLYPHLAQSTS